MEVKKYKQIIKNIGKSEREAVINKIIKKIM